MKHDNKPLTLEELRQMDGQPVWGVSLASGKPGEWFIVRVVEMSKCWFIACAGASHGFGDKDTYGESWLAYAQKPIDLDDWTAEWKQVVTHNGCTPDYDCVCSKCGASGNPNYGFCSSCGRAISDKARGIIERRLNKFVNE